MFKNKLIYRIMALFLAAIILLIAAFGIVAVFCISNDFRGDFYSSADQAIQSGFADSVQSILNSSKREFVKQYEIEQLSDRYSCLLYTSRCV